MATIADVARLAGVATSTVSHVLNGTRFVSAETTRAVHDAVQAVGYTPNILARALARSTTNTVGLALSSTRNRYFSDVINAVEKECVRLGLMVIVANTNDDPDQELAIVAALHQRRVDGIIFAPSCDPANRALDYLRNKHVPTVMVDRLPAAPFDGVGVENRDALGTMVDHLVAHGHRRLGFLSGQATFTTAIERTDGFRAGLHRNGLPVQETCISSDHVDLASARAGAARLLTGADRVTALVGGNNLTTIGIMLAARDRGLRVPEDVAVVGFDDFEWADAFEPRLTAMVQPCDEIGRAAASLLKRRIEDPDAPIDVQRLAPAFVIRDSCGSHPTTASRTGTSARTPLLTPLMSNP